MRTSTHTGCADRGKSDIGPYEPGSDIKSFQALQLLQTCDVYLWWPMMLVWALSVANVMCASWMTNVLVQLSFENLIKPTMKYKI